MLTGPAAAASLIAGRPRPAVGRGRLDRTDRRTGTTLSLQEGFHRLNAQRRHSRRHPAPGAIAAQRLRLSDRKQERPEQIYLVCIDFENAFKSVDHESVWRWLLDLNIPYIDLLRALYQGLGGRRHAPRDPRPRAKSATRDPRPRATLATWPNPGHTVTVTAPHVLVYCLGHQCTLRLSGSSNKHKVCYRLPLHIASPI